MEKGPAELLIVQIVLTKYEAKRSNPLDNFRIWIKYSDAEGVVDLADLAGRGVFKLWNDYREFQKVHLGASGEIAWGEQVAWGESVIYGATTVINGTNVAVLSSSAPVAQSTAAGFSAIWGSSASWASSLASATSVLGEGEN